MLGKSGYDSCVWKKKVADNISEYWLLKPPNIGVSLKIPI